LVDGEVGSETFGALGGAQPSPSPAAGSLPSLTDLELDAPKKPGSSGQKVRLIQGWLSLHGFELVVDGGYGDATARQVRAFQTATGTPVAGIVARPTARKPRPAEGPRAPPHRRRWAARRPRGRLCPPAPGPASARGRRREPWTVGPPLHPGKRGKGLT